MNVATPTLLLGLGLNPQNQTRFFVLLDEPRDDWDSRPQETFDFGACTVACAEPYDLWRVTAKDASFLKVGVVGDNREAIIFGILPNRGIVRASQPTLMNMSRIWIDSGQHDSQVRREIFVEKKLHAFEISSLRSRSAA